MSRQQVEQQQQDAIDFLKAPAGVIIEIAKLSIPLPFSFFLAATDQEVSENSSASSCRRRPLLA